MCAQRALDQVSADSGYCWATCVDEEVRMHRALIVLIAVVTGSFADLARAQGTRGGGAAPAGSKIYRLEELTWPQIDALNRDRTMFILPVGMIEQHGPHLPVGADTLAMTYEANGAATRVSRALPDWAVVMMPPLNYGHSGAQSIPAPTPFASRRSAR